MERCCLTCVEVNVNKMEYTSDAWRKKSPTLCPVLIHAKRLLNRLQTGSTGTYSPGFYPIRLIEDSVLKR